jgi:hypothetical protein
LGVQVEMKEWACPRPWPTTDSLGAAEVIDGKARTSTPDRTAALCVCLSLEIKFSSNASPLWARCACHPDRHEMVVQTHRSTLDPHPITVGERTEARPDENPSVSDPCAGSTSRRIPNTEPSLTLLGRTEESARIEALLLGARGGQSNVLVVSGEPGIGKSALLRFAHQRAADMTILSARGLEAEVELPYHGLADLFRPMLGRLKQLPNRQAAALASALALGPSVPTDRFTVSVAALSLLAAAAEEEPLLCLIDDAHWLDRPSQAAMVHGAAPRSRGGRTSDRR